MAGDKEIITILARGNAKRNGRALLPRLAIERPAAIYIWFAPGTRIFLAKASCYTRRFAPTIFSATQRCNIGTMLSPFETRSQQLSIYPFPLLRKY